MTQELLRFGPNEIASGIFPGVVSENAPLWVDSRNISFYNGQALSGPGTTRLSRIGVRVHEIKTAFVRSRRRVYALDHNKRVWAWDEGDKEKVIGRTSSTAAQLVPYGRALLVAERGNRAKIWWDEGTLERIKEAPNARLMHVHKQHVLALATQEGSNHVCWSKASDPLVWEWDSTNDARGLHVRGVDSGFRAVRDIGERVAAYTRESIIMFEWVGRPFVYREVHRLDGIGVPGRNCVIGVGYQNFGFSPFGLFVTDGNQFERIDMTALGPTFVNTVDWERSEAIAGLHHKEREEIQFFYTDTNANRRGVGFNYRTGAWAKYNSKVWSASERDVFPHPLLGQDDGVYRYEGRTKQQTRLRSKPITLGARVTLWEAIVMVISGKDVWLRVGLHDMPDEDPTWVLDRRMYHTAIIPQEYRESVYLTFELYTENAGWFELSQIVILGEPVGEFM